MKHVYILVICIAPFFSNVMQLLSLIRGFELYFHKNGPKEAMEHSNPDADDLNLLNYIMQAVTFLQMWNNQETNLHWC